MSCGWIELLDSQTGVPLTVVTFPSHFEFPWSDRASKLWVPVPSAQGRVDTQGKCTGRAAGVYIVILLFNRMWIHTSVYKSGHVGSRIRIVWVRLKGPICPIFFIVVYIPHKYRKTTPQADDTIAQLESLIQTVPKNDCLVVCGDFNCQLKCNVAGCTRRWAMIKKNEQHYKDTIKLS